jgi:indolepyruvate ferredoxin oxidoreductase beta subunit
MKSGTFNCMIAGVGGQGTVLASKLIAAAAMKKGYDVRTTETIGMAQRGGSVFGHVRIGKDIFSPLIPLGKANVIIAFEPAEAVRQLPYLCKDSSLAGQSGSAELSGSAEQSLVISCDTAIKPITGSYDASAMLNYLQKFSPRLIILDGRRLTAQSPKTLNVALLGAAAQSRAFPFDADTLSDVIKETLPKRFLEMNIKAFELGRELCP